MVNQFYLYTLIQRTILYVTIITYYFFLVSNADAVGFHRETIVAITYLFAFSFLFEVPFCLYLLLKGYLLKSTFLFDFIIKSLILFPVLVLHSRHIYFPPNDLSNLFDIYFGVGYGLHTWDDFHLILAIKYASNVYSDEPFLLLVDDNGFVTREALINYCNKLGCNSELLIEKAEERTFHASLRGKDYINSTTSLNLD
jgi:hypothetical protein